MSVRFRLDMWCDACGTWTDGSGCTTATRVRRFLKKKGWVRRRKPGGLVLRDLCPECAKKP